MPGIAVFEEKTLMQTLNYAEFGLFLTQAVNPVLRWSIVALFFTISFLLTIYRRTRGREGALQGNRRRPGHRLRRAHLVNCLA